MLSSILNILSLSISAAVNLFQSIMSASGLSSFYLVMVFIFLVSSRLLFPLIGSRGSDRAGKEDKN